MKKNRIKMNILSAAAVVTMVMLSGCAAATETSSFESTAETKPAAAANGEAGAGGEASAQKSTLSQNQAVTAKAAEDLFSDRDMEQSPDTSDAKQLEVKDGETVSVTEEGIYVVTGTASECTIKVDAGKDAKVQLVLSGVNITNTSTPAIYVVSADKVFVTSQGENSLSVTGDFTADGETNTDAVVFAKDDIVFNGTGSLTVNSANGNGISGKDDVKFTGGAYDITSAKDAVEAKDTLAVGGGSFTIKSDKDGFHAEDSDDSTKGEVYITGGSFNITAKNDGIQGTVIAQIDGGDITIDSKEGIEAAYVVINGGNINITASDDGINASSGAAGSQSDFMKGSTDGVGIEINGGEITVTMGSGDTDGIDSNGTLTITGGTISVNTGGNAFDYEGTPVFTGGKIYVNGEEKTEVPVDMMGGGFGGGKGGGFGGGKGGFDGQRPDFDGEMPEGFEPPEGFDGQRPDFNGEMPEGFEPPEGFDGKMPENFKGRGKRGESSSSDSTFET